MPFNVVLTVPRRLCVMTSLCLAFLVGACEGDSALDTAGERDSDANGEHEDPKTAAKACDEDNEPSASWVALEDEVLELVNKARAKGASCGSKGSFDPAPALRSNATLRCAARAHSQDMVEREFFDHENPDGKSPMDRMKRAGYDGRYAGENIAAGQTSAQAVMDGWMKSDGHCANIMNARYKELGVGYVRDANAEYTHYWTQNFGAR